MRSAVQAMRRTPTDLRDRAIVNGASVPQPSYINRIQRFLEIGYLE